MNDNETKEYPIDQFLAWVADVARKDDRGTLAELRCGLSKTMQDRAWDTLIPDFYKGDVSGRGRGRMRGE